MTCESPSFLWDWGVTPLPLKGQQKYVVHLPLWFQNGVNPFCNISGKSSHPSRTTTTTLKTIGITPWPVGLWLQEKRVGGTGFPVTASVYTYRYHARIQEGKKKAHRPLKFVIGFHLQLLGRSIPLSKTRTDYVLFFLLKISDCAFLTEPPNDLKIEVWTSPA